MTTSWSRGNSTVTFLRLCSRAPRTTIRSWGTPVSLPESRQIEQMFQRFRRFTPGIEEPGTFRPELFRPRCLLRLEIGRLRHVRPEFAHLSHAIHGHDRDRVALARTVRDAPVEDEEPACVAKTR